jgi:hypothetical protein
MHRRLVVGLLWSLASGMRMQLPRVGCSFGINHKPVQLRELNAVMGMKRREKCEFDAME